MRRALFLLLGVFTAGAAAQAELEPANAVLLVAKPGLGDPNFKETVVLVTQAADGSTVGVILNRPGARTHEKTGDPVGFGGPVMREVLVALFRAERPPEQAAFHVLKGVYLTMHPQNIDLLLEKRDASYRLFAGFSGWGPGQLDAELARDGWFVVPASTELLFRADSRSLWEELARKPRGRVARR